ncbi:zinc finger BED domain-containing protein [Scomber japonicus]|uniref:zinc finger BED domain-containing protein n=1 Tax=Scomber japonicus TaxID=13676 RepID=UPI0023052B33|nr:zinc finger BED domain-containing protein [Scomber japonicus]
MSRRRSVVWGFFKAVDSDSVQCLLCKNYLGKGEQGTTTAMLRHLRVKHPTEVAIAEKSDGHGPETAASNGVQDLEADRGQFCSVEVSLDDGDSDTITTVNEADINSAINGILEAAQGAPVEQRTDEEASGRCLKRRRNTRSLIWRHFERLESLAAARCRICKKKIQCFDSSTSNLHRHMSKRHPEASQLAAVVQNPPISKSSHGSNTNVDTSTPPVTVEVSEQREFSDVIKDSRMFGGERRVFRREHELIEALRRAQREEARALEHQRELLEKLHAVNAREAAAEREQIESLRKAQQEEAKDLNRQREELKTEKAELQKKWEELQREKEELLFSRGQSAS